MSNQTLKQILHSENLYLNEGQQWGTNKFCVHPYADKYEELFTTYKNKQIKILEIGVYHGGSAIIWDKYFPLADITIVDIEPRLSVQNITNRVDHSRTRIVINDAYSDNFVKSIGNFDIVIDDGPHDLQSQLNFIKLYYPKLNDGGLLIIEDVQHGHWFEEMIKLVSDKKHECIDYSGYKTDSKLFILWK